MASRSASSSESSDGLQQSTPTPTPAPTHAKDWTGQDDPANSRNWALPRKALSTAVVGSLAFVCTMAASIYSPGHEQVSAQFHVSATVALLPLCFYNLGLAVGSTVGTPLSEAFGRKVVYLTTTPIFALFIIGSGFSNNITALTICRFFAGSFGSPGISLAAATLGDIYPPVRRALPMAIYYSMPFLGSVLGPLIGGFVVERKGWRWTQWTIVFFAVAILSPALLIHETYKRRILQCRAKDLDVEGPTSTQRSLTQEIRHFMTSAVTRPVHMLFTESIVGCVCLYSSFIFGLLYSFVVASPYVFSTVYGFSLGAQGLSFLGFIAGCLVAPLPVIAIDRLIYQRKLARLCVRLQEEGVDKEGGSRDDRHNLAPEERLYGAMIGSILLPVGMFWFGWTARPTIHWLCPIVAQAITILGALLIWVTFNLYIMDTYGPLYGASANGASSLSRYTVSAAFPLFTLQMYQRLGIGWATSLLGFVLVALAPIPWVFNYWGPKLRARSSYQHGD